MATKEERKEELKELLAEMFRNNEIEIEVTDSRGGTTVEVMIDGSTVYTSRTTK